MTVPKIAAVKWLGPMIGATLPQIFKGSNGCYYVVKGEQNPRGVKTLANELLASLILKRLGIPTPETAIIDIPETLIEDNAELQAMEFDLKKRWAPGLAFGSKMQMWGWRSLLKCPMFDLLPERLLGRVQNLRDFVSVLVFDAWSGQCDRRQALFIRRKGDNEMTALMIDNEACFGGSTWKLKSDLEAYFYSNNAVYDSVMGIDAFEQIFRSFRKNINLKTLTVDSLEIPEFWYGSDSSALGELIHSLADRLSSLESLVSSARASATRPFPNWVDHHWLQPRPVFKGFGGEIVSGQTLAFRTEFER